ncbi:MAG: hypothetical protein IT443_11980 [Phycisphaeraceae bacterium]|nr:hypothetical protein [Phycisphaeraceae bacterium]
MISKRRKPTFSEVYNCYMNRTVLVKVLETKESPGVYVPAVVREIAMAWGTFRLLIDPVGGSGTAWVDAGRVIPPSDADIAAAQAAGVPMLEAESP